MSDLLVHAGVYWRKDPVLLVSPDGKGWEEFKPTIRSPYPDGRSWEPFVPMVWAPPAQIGRAVTDPVRETVWESNWTGPALQAAMRPVEGFDLTEYGERAYRGLPRRHRELIRELTVGPVDRRQFADALELYGRYLERSAMIDAIDANALALSNRLASGVEQTRREIARLMFIDSAAPVPPRTNCKLTNISGARADNVIIDDPFCPPDKHYLLPRAAIMGKAGELVTPEFWGMDAHRVFYELPAQRAPRRGVLEATAEPLVDPSVKVAFRDCVRRVDQGEPLVAPSSGRVRRDRGVTDPFTEVV